jgi:hypothetical protein
VLLHVEALEERNLLSQGLVFVPSPQIPAGLGAAAPISASDIWAVGSQTISGTGQAPLAEHFDGKRWSVVSTPSPTSDSAFNGVAAAASKDVWAVGSGGTNNATLIEHWNGTNWSEVSSPTLPTGSVLKGVTAPASNNAWAVGTNSTSNNALVEHWDGTNWSVVSSPAFTGVRIVSNVSADSTTDVWVLGQANSAVGAPFNGEVALHWDGQTWSIMSAAGSLIDAVTALSPTDVWGSGFHGVFFHQPDRTVDIPQVVHWDGTSWSIVSSPDPNSNNPIHGSRLNGIAAISANDIWAVGTNENSTLTEHWDGMSWKVINSPNPGQSNSLSGVTALSDGTVAAVGSQFSSTTGTTPLILQDAVSAPKTGKTTSPALAASATSSAGNGLHVVASPFINNSTLSAAVAIADNDIWAVGSFATGSTASTQQTLAEHFDGTSWSVVPTPAPQGSSFAGVAGVASTDVWAVGASGAGGTSQSLIEHWNGTSWSVVSSPQFSRGSFLTGVTVISSSDAWAVGTVINSTTALVEHWDGTTWSVVSSPAFSGVGVNGISADSSTDVWAVGGATKLHWDGTSWSLVAAPSKVSTGAVTVLSATNIWAVGVGPGVPHPPHSAFPTAAIEHWDGKTWSVIPSPDPDLAGSSFLAGIAAVSAKDIWAVGGAANGPVIEHWNGSKWSLVTLPSGVSGLNGVTALSDGTIVAVGVGSNNSAVILEN